MTHDVTFESFEQTVDENSIVILDFWAGWCKPCQTYAPLFEQMSEIHSDIFFGKVNTEMAIELARAFNIQSIPTLMAFKKADLVFEASGLLPAQEFQSLIEKLRTEE